MTQATQDTSLVRCARCGANNRLDERARRATPRCGRCGAELPVQPPHAMPRKPVELNDQTLEDALRRAGDRPVLLDCWAAWCGPCRMLAPIIDALAADNDGKWVIAKLNVEQSPRSAARFQISSIPTILFFKNGTVQDRIVGLAQREALEARLKRLSG